MMLTEQEMGEGEDGELRRKGGKRKGKGGKNGGRERRGLGKIYCFF